MLEGTPLTEIAMSPSPLLVLLLMQPTNHNRFVVNAKLIINPLAASSVCVRCGMWKVIAIVTGPETKCDSLDGLCG